MLLKFILRAAACTTLILAAGLARAAGPVPHVAEGPIVLHGGIDGQWGGHTMSYLLESPQALYWSARLAKREGEPWTVLVGQYPKPGSNLIAACSKIPLPGADVMGCNQPQMLLTPDGQVHIFFGESVTTADPQFNTGRLHYYRSEQPGDISKLVDRTELLPTQPFEGFHLRMNVGVSRDGSRMALVALAISADGHVPFNTPVIFMGERTGADFSFRAPVAYAEPMALFYPLVAATEQGVVIIGQNWNDHDRAGMRLIHLDWDGKEIHRQDLPAPAVGVFTAHDLRPEQDDDWSKLIVTSVCSPRDNSEGAHEFRRYDTQMHKLELLRSIKTDAGKGNSGHWARLGGLGPVFVNNPSMGRLYTWTGPLFSADEVTAQPLEGADIGVQGYPATNYLYIPNVLQGSVSAQEGFYLGADCHNPEKKQNEAAPCSFLLWRVEAR